MVSKALFTSKTLPRSKVQALSTASVSAVAVLDLADALIKHGVIRESDLARLSLDLLKRYQTFATHNETDKTPIQEQHLPEHYFIWLWQQLDQQEQSTKVRMALSLGEHTETGRLGVLANWLRHCSTLEEALSTFIEHKSLLNHSEQWRVHTLESENHITIKFDDTKSYPYIAVLRSFSSIVTWAKFLTNKSLHPTRLEVQTQDEVTLAELTHYFDCTIKPGAKHDCLIFNSDVLEFPIVTANSYLNELVGQQAKSLKQTLMTASISEKLQALLQSDLARYSTLSECLTELNMSRSTLFRKLKAEGTQFSELLDQARKERHQKLVNQGRSNADISDALGFSEISAFYKFLKR